MDGNKTHALNHQASYAFYYRQRHFGQYIREHDIKEVKADPIKNPTLGVNAQIEIKKSSSDKTLTVVEVPIKFDGKDARIWSEKELFDALILSKFDLAIREKAWITISDGLIEMAKKAGHELQKKHNGLPKFSEYFSQNPTICNWLIEQLRTVILCENEMTAALEMK